MPVRTSDKAVAARRTAILDAARWCFLNFGFAKTTLEDISTRAGISRTLLYRSFRNKEDIFSAVFADWLVARHPAARAVANGPGSRLDRLVGVCRAMVLEPWEDMVGAPMAAEFHDVCERLDPALEVHHRQVALECVAAVIGDVESATVFLLALDGQLADEPTPATLEQRVVHLASRFTSDSDRTHLPPSRHSRSRKGRASTR